MSYLTPKGLAAHWACSPSYIRRLIRTGQLSALRLGSEWRVSEQSAAAYEARQMTGEQPAPEPAIQAAAPCLTVDGFLLPDDYEPVYPALWGLEPTTTARAALSAAGPGRTRAKKERRFASTKRR